MKRILIAGTSLSAVVVAGAAGAVDITLGGSIDMGVEYGIGKDKGSLAIGSAFNKVTLSIAAAGTTDAGLKYGGSFGLATAAELKFDYYDTNGTVAGGKHQNKITVKNYTDLKAAAYNVSGGQKLDADSIVAVKINSEWKSVSNNTRTLYGHPLNSSGINSSNICKVAGRVQGRVHDGVYGAKGGLRSKDGRLGWGGPPTRNPVAVNPKDDGQWPVATAYTPAWVTHRFAVTRATPKNEKVADVITPSNFPKTPGDGYLPAGRLDFWGYKEGIPVLHDNAAWNIALTAATSDMNSNKIVVHRQYSDNIGGKGEAGPIDGGRLPEKGDAVPVDKFQVLYGVEEISDDNWAPKVVKSAQVFAGPFMSVKLRSSSTKMVIGAVCVTGKETSETAFYMDNVSKVVTASDASIYIEGGFGKLTLQTGDYAGAVSKIGDAGDQADIGADGLVAIVSGVGLLGANPYVAVDLAPESSLNSLEVLTGGTIDMGGLTAAVDIELDNADGVIGIGSWDLGLGYSMGDADVDFVIDSANAWGMKASMAVAGFGVDATIYNKATAAHKKNGLFYSVSASTDLNGFGLSLGVDQDMKPTVGLSYDVGSMNIYAGYDAADKGGKVGAKLSF